MTKACTTHHHACDCREAEWAQKMAAQQLRIEGLEDSVRFFAIRCEELQEIQSRMRDPERQMVCDILANGKPRDKAGIGEYKALLPGGGE